MIFILVSNQGTGESTTQKMITRAPRKTHSMSNPKPRRKYRSFMIIDVDVATVVDGVDD